MLRVVPVGGNCANPGERCTADETCQPSGGLFVCTPKQDLGAACGSVSPCKTSLRCENTCMAKLGPGVACSFHDDCLTGYCDEFPPSGTAKTCLPGLIFAPNAPACLGFFGARTTADAGVADAPAADAPPADAPPADAATD
jgi:hypothetical protein